MGPSGPYNGLRELLREIGLLGLCVCCSVWASPHQGGSLVAHPLLQTLLPRVGWLSLNSGSDGAAQRKWRCAG